MNKSINRMEICDSCTGCAACSALCPQNAINMSLDAEGFFHYNVDDDKCVGCGLCTKACPEKSNDVSNVHVDKYKQLFYAVRNQDLEVVKASSSGGVFSALASYIIKCGGIVYGVVVNYPSCRMVYERATTIEELVPMRGSKYVQAELSSETLNHIKTDVKSGRIVFFSGTSCYVNGVKRFLTSSNLELDNIYFMDFICAGVVSNKIWSKCINYLSDQLGLMKKISFRDKSNGWRDFCCVWEGDTSKKRELFTLSDIGLLQSKEEALGRACNECKYRSYDRPGDITVGDFWNEQYLPKKWWDDKGISAVLINSLKGEVLFKAIGELIDFEPVDRHMVYNSRFEESRNTTSQEQRDELYSDVDNMDYREFRKKWISKSILDRMILGIVRPVYLKIGIHRYKK